MKGYCTKYALTRGIFEVTIVGPNGDEDGYTEVTGCSCLLREGRTLFRDRAAAEQNAKEQACRKLRALYKKRTELERLASSPKWDRK